MYAHAQVTWKVLFLVCSFVFVHCSPKLSDCYLKTHTTVSFETALAWTLVLSLLKSVYLNPKSKLRVVDIYKIRFNRALWFFWSLIFYSKPVHEYSFSHLLKLFYRIWLKRIEAITERILVLVVKWRHRGNDLFKQPNLAGQRPT